ncbi:30S ribosomal protein S17 [Candidatus Peregrinibacteria bacterium RIFOXYC2_FULL_33_13]|nr:MAG: 30S ribosomal protein S17 [Candidatus Peregrinibacteria bacterium GW2011_GWA2_33_10]KKP40746.1 MAG: 30S ribosomal protein S17, small subunit ribosomal protein S17 [Candidatus Peregrinibacteria bacterium GW2011_GWC2_33_13]OGJ51105.1 MAG: 30S ribosomal protein S17 [Candidatus Peregrinibacteria bacterium RIFOXYA2_FULL_33_7]OGJ55451.1 MAG: 30S ribosomal protein S17 [Candidatus Peregrinibacteria bacterium RIFOXYC2_FULL_33_13]
MRSKTGIVTSAKNDKTIIVTVHAYKTHPKYKKQYRVTNKFHAHDPENKHQLNETVTIYETRPISKLKRWTVIKPEQK